MSYSASSRPDRSGSPEYDSSSPDPGSSGAGTPSAGATLLASSISSLWGGLLRTFSSESSDPSSSNPPIHHARTFPAAASSLNGHHTPPHHHTTTTTTTTSSSSRLRSLSPMRPPPLDPLQLRGFAPETPASARLLTPAVAEEIRIMVPTRLAIVDEWSLVYSLEQDGASLATLYDKAAAYRGRRVGFVLVVRDLLGGTFGAYLSDLPHPAPKYFGTGECFLWRASVLASLPPPPSADTTRLGGRTTTVPASTSSGESIRFKAFPYSGINEYYMLCEQHFLSVGAGDGRYGLWLDDGLAKGISSPCQTFGNERLSDEGDKFGVLGVELWVVGG